MANAVSLRLACLFFVLLLNAAPSLSQTCGESQDPPYALGANEAITRNMTRSQRHVYQLSLLERQHAHIVVDQKGTDVVLRMLDPNMQLLTERDSPNGKFGPEAISVVAQASGNYLLEVCSGRSEPAGSYHLRVAGPRESTANDEKRMAAEQTLMQARKLAAERKPETLTSAIELFTKALQTWREVSDAREEGYALCHIGESYRFLLNFAEAKKFLDQSLPRLADAGELSGQAYVLNQLGAAHRDLDDPRKALPYYTDALALRTRIGDRWGQAQIHNNVGFLYSEIGEQQVSIANSELAIPIWRELEDRAMELNTTNNIAKANLDLGNLTSAFQQFQLIVDYCTQSAGPCALEPFARNSLGVIHDTWGEPTEALSQYYRALELFQDANNKRETARVLDNIGMVFAGMGDAHAAIQQFLQALKIRETELNHAGEEITRSNLGYAYMLLGQNTEALKELEQAKQFSITSRNQRFEAFTLMRTGLVHTATKGWEQALSAYNQAFEIQKRIEDRRGQAITVDKIAELYSLMAQPDLALKNYQQALSLWTSVGDQQGEALSLYGIARVQRNQGKLLEARDKIVEAVAKVESLRTMTTSHRLRMSYFAARRDFYELEIDVRMSLYNETKSPADLELALFASERAHARNLLDVLNESHADIRQGVDPQLLDQERSQRAQLSEKLSQLQQLLNRKHTAEQRTNAEREIQALTRSFDQTQAEIRRRSPRYAALTQPQPLRPAQIQQLLDVNTVLLEYAIGEERSYLWVVTRTGIRAFTLPGRAEIEKAIGSFRESVTAWELKPASTDTERREQIAKLRSAYGNYLRRARELSNIVLKPAARLFGNKRLVIVADGMLQYISFGALLAPGANGRSNATPPVALIAKHEIIYQPSASVLALIRQMPRPTPSKTLAVFADPVFDKADKRVQLQTTNGSTAIQTAPAFSSEFMRALRDAGDVAGVDGPLHLDRLDYSRGEAEAIVATAPPGSYLKAIDFEASRANFLKQDLKEFAVVHVATHGLLNGQNPELSGVVFSLVDERGNPENGFLRLADIYNLNLPVNMVVLSACRTGVGQPVKGEGLIGLTRGFIHAGASRVVASLWKVDDEATAELMKRFYTYMLQ
ncbi:MAG TPA: CHAT domain-containing protein, partial [Pyrinomonadaceae bacterium]|nr:CHAT domain-containing protein [Pyrinomonadaceae bacterium]